MPFHVRVRLLPFLFCYAGFLNSSLAQQNFTLPRVIPPSPEAATLFRFLDYPVTNATGIPDIKVPVYEVKSGTLSVPITLSYHAGGRRVTDETGAAGLGWALHAGGMIARTIYGAPDELRSFPYELKKADRLTNATDYAYLSEIYPSPYRLGSDSEYDIFSYYFGTKSGKFVLSSDRDSVYLLAQEPIQFTGSGFPSAVVDEHGDRYEFNQEQPRATSSYGSYLTEKLLSKIISANKQDTITFHYRLRSRLQAAPTTSISVLDNNQTRQTPGGQYQATPTYVSSYGISYTGISRLALIRFREGWVKFTHATRPNARTGQVDTTDQVASIQLFRRDGQLLKTVRLEMTPLQSFLAVPTVTLGKLLFQDSTGETIEHYSFDYYADAGGAGLTYNSHDFWGYYNGYSGNSALPPYTLNAQTTDQDGRITGFNPVRIGEADRQPNYFFAKQGVLRRITYPTGGSTEFTYEGNYALRNGRTYSCPGLRIGQITTTATPGGLAQVRTFRYGELTEQGVESGAGERGYLTANEADFGYETRYFPDFTSTTVFLSGREDDYRSYRKRTYSDDFLPGVADFANEPVFYATVTEYLGTPTSNLGKTVYRYTAPTLTQVGTYRQLNYPSLLPIGMAANGQISMISNPWSYLTDDALQLPYVSQYNQWTQSQLGEKTDYKYDEATKSYQPVHSTFYTYQAQQLKLLRGTHIYKNIVVGSSSDEQLEKFMVEKAYMPLFSFADYYIATGKTQLLSTTEKQYSDAGTFTTSTSYVYNDQLLVRERQQTTSTGQTQRTVITYPFDSPTVPVHQQMLAQHQLDYPVQQRTYAGTQLLTTTYTHYQLLTRKGTTFITPIRLLTATGNNPLQARQLFDYWDTRGNMTEQHKAYGVREAYQWGYRQRYPIAHVVNAQNQEEPGPVLPTTAYGTIQYSYANAGAPPASLPAQQFTTSLKGPVTLNLSLQGAQGTTPSYPRAQPVMLFQCYLRVISGSGYAQTQYLKAGGPCASVSASQDNLTFDNVPPGTYQLEVMRLSASISAADCFEAQGNATLNYTYTASTAIAATGLKEFYVENFEENLAQSATTYVRTGARGSDGRTFTVPFKRPNSRTYVLDWQQWEGTRWVYHREPYTSKTFAANTYVDDVRVYPADAQMTTYTYEPLVGLTSQTDPSGHIRFYEYDAIGRLVRTRDEQGRILSQQQYHYAGQ